MPRSGDAKSDILGSGTKKARGSVSMLVLVLAIALDDDGDFIADLVMAHGCIISFLLFLAA